MNSPLPDPKADIHPWMPASMHGFDSNRNQWVGSLSGLGVICKAGNISIHDREKVYDEMKKAEQKLLFPTN